MISHIPNSSSSSRETPRSFSPPLTSLVVFPPPPSPSSSSPDLSPQIPESAHASTSAPSGAPPSGATAAVLVHSEPIPEGWSGKEVKGIDFNNFTGRHVTASDLVRGMKNIGFQGSNLSEACSIIDEMRTWRSPTDPTQKATIFLGYTSNLVSSGLRETIRYLVQHKHVSAIVTTAGGVEEDLIKCLAPTYMGSFNLDGATLRSKGLNRIGNLLVPNNNYCLFEDWVVPILDKMSAEQCASQLNPNIPPDEKLIWTPSRVIARLGKEINNEESILYWAYKNNIPVFCPALTDGSLGDMLYFHSFRSPPVGGGPLVIDIILDIRAINTIAVRAAAAGMIILGGGVIKHHISNACLMRNGAEWAVVINVAGEYDGSDAGARPDEAVSWGKIKSKGVGGRMVKVTGEVTVVFPLVVAATWARPGGDEARSFREGKIEGTSVV